MVLYSEGTDNQLGVECNGLLATVLSSNTLSIQISKIFTI